MAEGELCGKNYGGTGPQQKELSGPRRMDVGWAKVTCIGRSSTTPERSDWMKEKKVQVASMGPYQSDELYDSWERVNLASL